ncbi:hypothetical protein HK101_004280 [Irineochytrium annulatum]|nr:hypothetical protein HK101_004280 [Irineochytrium annulatum]
MPQPPPSRRELLTGLFLLLTLFVCSYLFLGSEMAEEGVTPPNPNLGDPSRKVPVAAPPPAAIPAIGVNRNPNGVPILSFAPMHKTVLILTPLKNVEHVLSSHFKKLASLEYPKELISLGFLVSDSKDRTWLQLHDELAKLSGYRKVSVARLDFGLDLARAGDRHDAGTQVVRRAVLAKSRNYLLEMSLTDEEWVLWMDADLASYPKTMIGDLMGHGKEVVTVNTMTEDPTNGLSWYDQNTWIETADSLAYLETLPKDEVVFEGYPQYKTNRTKLNSLYNKTNEVIVPVDGVGAAVLLVKADVHRHGINFPAFPYKHAIETEGFAKLAATMGFQPYGLPNYLVLH